MNIWEKKRAKEKASSLVRTWLGLQIEPGVKVHGVSSAGG